MDAGPRDNLAAWAALEVARPGDVILIRTGEFFDSSVIGDIFVGMAKNGGVAAIVTDGVVRDIPGIDAVGIPVFARGVSPNSPWKNGPGRVGLPITIGGVTVDAGDIVVGDQDGVVIVPRASAAAVAEALAAVLAKEVKMDEGVKAGRVVPGWLEEAKPGQGGHVHRLTRPGPQAPGSDHYRSGEDEMPTHKVFYFSHAPENVYAIIREEVPPGLELVTLDADSDDERKRKIADCEAVIVAAKPMRREFVDAAPRLQLLHHQGVGYQDTVDVAALKARNIALALTPAGTTIGVAEHTVMLTLAVCKRLTFADSELRQGRWHINSLRPYSFELFGRTVGYVGMGRIGREAAARFKAFGTSGLYHDPVVRLSAEEERALGLSRVAFRRTDRARRRHHAARALRQGHPPPDRRGRPGPDEAAGDRHQHGPRDHRRREGAVPRAAGEVGSPGPAWTCSRRNRSRRRTRWPPCPTWC